MLKFVKAAFVSLIMLLPGAAMAQQTQIVAGWPGGNLDWEGTSSTQIRWNVVPFNGEALICGAYSVRGSSKYTRLSRVVMQQSKVRDANGSIVMNNISHFSNVSSAHFASNLVGQNVNCQSTGLAADDPRLNGLRLDIKTGRIRTP